MVRPVQVSSIQVAPVGVSDKKIVEVRSDRVNTESAPVSWGWQTPPVEAGYEGIARKAMGNVVLSTLVIGSPPLRVAYDVIRGGICMAVEVISAAGLMTCGVLGLIATPAILAKDLTHHTYRVLSQRSSDTEPSFKKN